MVTGERLSAAVPGRDEVVESCARSGLRAVECELVGRIFLEADVVVRPVHPAQGNHAAIDVVGISLGAGHPLPLDSAERRQAQRGTYLSWRPMNARRQGRTVGGIGESVVIVVGIA